MRTLIIFDVDGTLLRSVTPNRTGGEFERVIAVEDGRWDVRAAVATGCEFIGVGASTTPFGEWFPSTHLIASFEDLDLDYTLSPPPGAIGPVPDVDKPFTGHPGRCTCWS